MLENKTKKTYDDIPSLYGYVFAPDDIKKAVSDLEIYWQLSNQAGVKLYTKWQGKKYSVFHNLKELHDYLETKELFDLTTGKPWSTLISAIDLTARYSPDVDMNGFNKLSQEHKLEILDIITKGHDAYEKLTKWLKPLDVKDCIDAIHDCVKVKIGNSKYDLVNILRLSNTKTLPDPDRRIGLFPNVLELESTQSIISYFSTLEKPIPNSLIVTFLKDKKYNNTPHIYLFLAYEDSLYVINMDDQTLNQSWTTGIRQRDRYDHWYHFPNVWLPFKSILKTNRKNSTTALVYNGERIVEQTPLNDIFKNHPEAKVWLDMFTYIIIDWLELNQKKIMIGTTPEHVLKPMLEHKEQKTLGTHVKLQHIAFDENPEPMGESFGSTKDSASYLFKKYGSKITSIVPSIKKIPIMLATKEHIENVIIYEQRKLEAQQLQKLVNDDFRKNHKRVYSWLRKFVKSQNTYDVIKKALKDNEYSFMYFGGFPEKNEPQEVIVNGHNVKLNGKSKIQKCSILDVFHYKKDHRPTFFPDENMDLDLIMLKNNDVYDEYPKRSPCNICKNYQWKYFVRLEFIDYRQLCEFFEVDINDIPKEFVDHFHYQNTLHHENSWSDDCDPAYNVKDPWFRKKVDTMQTIIINDRRDTNPRICIYYGLCSRCFTKLGGTYDDTD